MQVTPGAARDAEGAALGASEETSRPGALGIRAMAAVPPSIAHGHFFDLQRCRSLYCCASFRVAGRFDRDSVRRCGMKWIGIVLVILGIVAIVYGVGGFNRERTVLEIGGVKATVSERSTSWTMPALGAVAVLGGVVLLTRGRRVT